MRATQLGLLLVALSVAGCSGNRDSVQALYDNYQDRGFPLDTDRFEAQFAVKPEDNCAPELLPALERLAKLSKVDPAESKDGKFVRTLKERQALLKPLIPHLVEIEKLAQKPHCVREANWNEGMFLLYPELARYREAVKILNAQALTSAETGNRKDALRWLTLMRILGVHCGESPGGLIPGLVHIALEAIRLRAIQQCLEADPAGRRDYAKLIGNPPMRPFGYYWKNEMFGVVATFRHPGVAENLEAWIMDGNSTAKPSPNAPKKGLPADPKAKKSVGQLLEMALPVAKLIDPHGGVTDETKLLHELELLNGKPDKTKSKDEVLLEAFLSVQLSMYNALQNSIAKHGLLRGYVRALNYYQENGRWPALIAGIADRDPMSKDRKLYGYKVTGKEMRIWSVGADRVDNGGLSRLERKGTEGQFDEVIIATAL